jgi:hypothetical protein
MLRPISRSDFARLAKVSPAAVTKACGKKLKPACVADLIDVESECAREYLAAHGVVLPDPAAPPTDPAKPKSKRSTKPAPGKPGSKRKRAANAGAPTPTSPVKPSPKRAGRLNEDAPLLDESGYADELKDLTLNEIVERHGTVRAYQKHLEAHVKREQALKSRISNAQKLGELIEWELIDKTVFGLIDAVFKRLLNDTPKTVSSRAYDLARSNAPLEEAEQMVRDSISSHLNPVKATAIRILRNG